MSNQSGQGNPSLPLDIQSSRSGNPFNDRSLGDQTVFENPQNHFNVQAGNHRNYSLMPNLNDQYPRSESLSSQQMIAWSNRFNIPYLNEGSQLNYPQDSNHRSSRENLQVPASLSIISPLNQYTNQYRQANLGESRQSRSGQVSNYLPDASPARDQFTNPRRNPFLSQISSQQSEYFGSIPSIEENIRQAQQIIDLHEQTARGVQAQNKRRERQP